MTSLCAVVLFSPTLTFAANPASPFSPSDNVVDPNCLPTDSNCYVSMTNMTFANATSTRLFATNASSTNFFSTLINAVTALFTNLTTTGTTTLATNGGRVGIGTTTPNHTLDVQGNIGLASSGYINFGAVDSTSGYGFRDNAGAIEYKNSNGGWTSFASAGAGGGQLLAVYSTSTVGTNITVNFNGSANSSPSYSGGVLTLPSNASHVVVETWGAGGGGSGSNSGATGGTGGNTCFGTNSTACTSAILSATGGTGGTSSGGGSVAGTGTGGDINLTGSASAGLSASNASLNYSAGGAGGSAPLGGGGGGSTWSSSGTTGARYGGGGGGGGIYSANSSCAGGGGGAGGGYARKLISNPSGAYYYTVGAGGAGTVAGSACGVGSQYGGGDGGSGGITISVYTSGVSNGSVGSGLTGYIPYYGSTGTNLSATSSIFLSTTGNVGIGTSTPLSKLSVQGDFFLEGSNRYLNFGNATGTAGYGFRDNAGVLEFKNSSGSWTTFSTSTASGVAGPSFSVNKNSATQVVTSSTVTPLTWSTEVFDTNNNFASNRFTPTVAGKYIINLNVYCGDGAACYAYIYKNGIGTTQTGGDGSAGLGIVSTSILLDMNGTTDYVEAYGYTSGTYIAGGVNQTFFTGALIAPVNATAGGWQNDNTSSFLADSTDFVGIGTSSPTAKLSIQGTAGFNPFMVASSTGASLFSILQNGNIGIGTIAPAAKLDVRDGNILLTDADVAQPATAYDVANAFGKIGSISGTSGGLDIWGFSDSDSQAMRFLSVIGSSNPTDSTPAMSFRADKSDGATGSVALGTLETVFQFANYTSPIMTMLGNGNVGIGTTNPAYRLTVAGPPNDWSLVLNETNGYQYGILAKGTTYSGYFVGPGYINQGAWTYGSDRRLKENISYFENGLDTIMRLKPAAYDYISGTKSNLGFIAQDVQEVIPEAVTITDPTTGMLGLKTEFIIPYLVNAVQNMNSVFNASNALNASSTIFSYYQGTTTPAITVGATGNVAIATSSSPYTLTVGNSLINGVIARFQNATGYCDINPTTTSLTCSSDERLKKNILSLDATSTFDKFIQLNPVTYNWIGETATGTHAGFIAQQVETLFPDLVATDEQGMKSVSYTGFIPYIIESVKSLARDVKALTLKVASFANLVETDKVKSKSICLENNGAETCISKEKLDAILLLLGETAANQDQNIAPPDTSTTTPDIATSTDLVASSTPEVVPEEAGGGDNSETETN